MVYFFSDLPPQTYNLVGVIQKKPLRKKWFFQLYSFLKERVVCLRRDIRQGRVILLLRSR